MGTVQFGMDYGIMNKKKPLKEDSIKCLDYATQNGIYAIDTAAAYGDAECIVGEFIHKRTIPRDKLFICSKMPPNSLDGCDPKDYQAAVLNNITRSLKRLRLDHLDAYLFHSSRYAFSPTMLEALYEAQRRGYAGKVGVSIYEVEEARACADSPYARFIQAPYSILDHRMKKSGLLDRISHSDCQLHTRSAFLQGLVLMEEEMVPGYLTRARPLIRKITDICATAKISRVDLALAYVRREKSISHLVFGVHTMEQLQEVIASFERKISDDVLLYADAEFADVSEYIVLPSLWDRH